MTREERAEISRRNGAKSKGPVTPEGKNRSRRNSMITGHKATVLKFFIPPPEAAGDRAARRRYNQILDGMLESFHPRTEHEAYLVRELAVISWRLEPLNQRSFWLMEAEYERICVRKDLYGESLLDFKLEKQIDALRRRESQVLNMLINSQKIRRRAA